MTALLLVLVGAAGGWWWGNRDTATAASATVRTQLVSAALGTVKQTVAASGTIEPAVSSTQSFSSSGTVTAVDVAVGDTVAKGQTLATIDDTALADAVTLAQAGVSAAQSQVSSGTSTSAVASANAQLTSAQQQLATAQTALAGATLTSPIAGTVASVGLAVGDQVGSSGSTGGSGGSAGTGGSAASGAGAASSSSSASSGSSIVVVNTASWVVNATVTSSDLAELKKGLQATITPTGSTTPVFGTVASVGIVASSSSSGTAAFPVVINVTGHPTGIYAGTSATVAITVKQLSKVLTVPTLAVSTSNGQTVVKVSKNGTVSTVPVTIGGVYGSTTEITKGLSEGDEVVVEVRSFGTGATGGAPRTPIGGGGFGGGGFGGGGFGGGAP